MWNLAQVFSLASNHADAAFSTLTFKIGNSNYKHVKKKCIKYGNMINILNG